MDSKKINAFCARFRGPFIDLLNGVLSVRGGGNARFYYERAPVQLSNSDLLGAVSMPSRFNLYGQPQIRDVTVYVALGVHSVHDDKMLWRLCEDAITETAEWLNEEADGHLVVQMWTQWTIIIRVMDSDFDLGARGSHTELAAAVTSPRAARPSHHVQRSSMRKQKKQESRCGGARFCIGVWVVVLVVSVVLASCITVVPHFL